MNELNRINELRKQLFDFHAFENPNAFKPGCSKDMIGFIREYAVKKGFQRVELCVGEFNRKASAVYEAAGFHTYKRSMEMIL